MKKAVSFRLDDKIIGTLASISMETGMTMTQLVNKSIEDYAKKIKGDKMDFLAYAGSLKSDDADKILNAIKHNKKNKEEYNANI